MKATVKDLGVRMKRWLTVFTILLFGSPSAGQQIPALAPVQMQTTGKWNVEYAQSECLLSRELIGGGGEALMSLSLEPLNSTAWLRVGVEGEHGRCDDGDAVMLIDGRRVPGTLHYNIYDAKQHRVREFMLDLKKHKLGSAQNSVRFWTKRHGDLELKLGNFPSAWGGVNKCMSDLYADLGIVEAELAQMATEPEGEFFSFITTPGRAMNFKLLYWVAADGRVDDCRLLQPSGIANFDESVCPELMKKGRFKPARKADGQPMRVPRFENANLRVSIVTTAGSL